VQDENNQSSFDKNKSDEDKRDLHEGTATFSELYNEQDDRKQIKKISSAL